MESAQQIKRYDQRDALPYRSRLMPGTKEHEIYYAMHPELEEMDNKIKIHFNEAAEYQLRLKVFPEDRLPNAWVRGKTFSRSDEPYAAQRRIEGTFRGGCLLWLLLVQNHLDKPD